MMYFFMLSKKGWIILLSVFHFGYDLCARDSNTLRSSKEDTLRLVHIYGYASLSDMKQPGYWGHKKPVIYIINKTDTVVMQPDWVYTFTSAVKKIEVFDIIFSQNDTVHIACTMNEFRKTITAEYIFLPGNKKPEFVSFMVVVNSKFMGKKTIDSMILLAPDIKRDLLNGVRKRIKIAEKKVIDLRDSI